MFSFVLLCLRFVGSVMFSFVCVSLFCSVVNEYFLLVCSLLVLRLLYAVG